MEKQTMDHPQYFNTVTNFCTPILCALVHGGQYSTHSLVYASLDFRIGSMDFSPAPKSTNSLWSLIDPVADKILITSWHLQGLLRVASSTTGSFNPT